MSALLCLTASERAALLDALCAAAWADGVLSPDEISASRGAALVLGTPDAEHELGLRLRSMRGAVRPLTALDGVRAPNELTAALAYTGAVWLAQVDGRLNRGERAALAALRRIYRIRSSEAVEFERAAHRVARGGSLRPEDRYALLWASEVEELWSWVVLDWSLREAGRQGLH